jgi:hypothetical protein
MGGAETWNLELGTQNLEHVAKLRAATRSWNCELRTES